MRLLLLDQSVPRGLKSALSGYEIHTAYEMGWAAVANGALLALAEESGFAIFVTSDQNLQYQQNLASRKIAIVSLSTNRWDTIKADIARVQLACDGAGDGTFEVVQFPMQSRRRVIDKPLRP